MQMVAKQIPRISKKIKQDGKESDLSGEEVSASMVRPKLAENRIVRGGEIDSNTRKTSKGMFKIVSIPNHIMTFNRGSACSEIH